MKDVSGRLLFSRRRRRLRARRARRGQAEQLAEHPVLVLAERRAGPVVAARRVGEPEAVALVEAGAEERVGQRRRSARGARAADRRAGRRSPRPAPPRCPRPAASPRPRAGSGPRAYAAGVAAGDLAPGASSSSSVHAATATHRSPTLAVHRLVAHGNTPWNARAVVDVAGARRAIAPVALVVEQPRRQRVDRRLDLRDVEVHAAAGAPPVEQPGGERGRDEARRERVGDRAVRADGLAVGPAGEEVVAGERRALAAEARGSPGAARSGRSGTRSPSRGRACRRRATS